MKRKKKTVWTPAQRAVWRFDKMPSMKYGHQDQNLDCPCQLCRNWQVGMEPIQPFRLFRRTVFK